MTHGASKSLIYDCALGMIVLTRESIRADSPSFNVIRGTLRGRTKINRDYCVSRARTGNFQLERLVS